MTQETIKQQLNWTLKAAREEVSDVSRKLQQLTAFPDHRFVPQEVLELNDFRRFLLDAAADIKRHIGLDIDLSGDDTREGEDE